MSSRTALRGLVTVTAVVLAGCGSSPTVTTDVVTTTSSTTAPRATTTKVESFSDLVARVRGGVIRIEVSGCGAQSVGTGFLVAPRLVATVDHVVDGATDIRLKRGSKIVGHGTVTGADPARDVALIRTQRAVDGYTFSFADRPPRLGDGVAALGFPLGLPLSVTRGTVSGKGRTVPIDGLRRRGLIQTDAALNPGNSGGPLLEADTGTVVGLVDIGSYAHGISFAVSSSVAKALIDAWQAAPQTTRASSCGSTAPSDPGETPQATASGVDTYDGTNFAVDYPADWEVQAAEKATTYGSDTTIADPRDAKTLLRVDLSSDPPSDPADGAQPVVDVLRKSPGYREIDLTRSTFLGHEAVVWEFVVRESGRLLHKQDVFFVDDHGRGVAILTQAPDANYEGVRSDFAALRGSYQER
jgi:S1-C subfamily serine protease